VSDPDVISGSFLARELCGRVVDELEHAAWWQWGEVNHGGRSHVNLRLRSAQVSPVVPSCEAVIAEGLHVAARTAAAVFGPVNSVEGPNLLRYRHGDFVGPHPDEDPRTRLRPRRVTVIAFLNDRGFSGGVLSLSSHDGRRSVRIPPRAGSFVAFPSSTLHAVSPTVGGNRYAVVAWLH